MTSPISNMEGHAPNFAAEGEAEIEHLKDKLRDVNYHILSFVKERPVACLLGAVAAGFIIGRLARR